MRALSVPTRAGFGILTGTALTIALGIPGSVGQAREPRAGHHLVAPSPRSERPDPVSKPSLPVRSSSLRNRAGGDTLTFGFVDENGFAVQGEVWTFDHGSDDPLEGWTSIDLYQDPAPYFRWVDEATWFAANSDTVAPVLSGEGSVWVGLFGTESEALCWRNPGYGNCFGQRLVSPTFEYGGAGDVEISWLFFNETEVYYDIARVGVVTYPGGVRTILRSYDGRIGVEPSGRLVPETDGRILHSGDFGGATQFRLFVELESDGSWSDEDGLWPTHHGPFGIDDIELTGLGPSGDGEVSFDFEDGLQGWVPELIPGLGDYVRIGNFADYEVPVEDNCGLYGNVVAFHDDGFVHANQQRNSILSPILDLRDVELPDEGPFRIWFEWDNFTEDIELNGVLTGVFWQYYPWICPETGEAIWSPLSRCSSAPLDFQPEQCENRSVFSWDGGVSPLPEMVRVRFDLWATSTIILPGYDILHPWPLLDNMRFRVTRALLPSDAPDGPGSPGGQDGGSDLSPPLSLQVWPTVLTERAEVRFSLRESAPCRLTVHNVRGQCVRTLLDELLSSGRHALRWDGRDDRGRPLAAGTYWLRLESTGPTVAATEVRIVR